MCFCSPNVLPKPGAPPVSRRSLRSVWRAPRWKARRALLRHSDLSPAELRQNVTSPKGTTAAALEVLMGKDGMRELLAVAVAAAAKRSKELSS